MKGKSWCLRDGHKYNLGCRNGRGYYGFHMCLQITDDAGTDSWSQVKQCQKGQRSPELAHCNPYLWFSDREAKYWSHELKNLLSLACSTVSPWRRFCYYQENYGLNQWQHALFPPPPSSISLFLNLFASVWSFPTDSKLCNFFFTG